MFKQNNKKVNKPLMNHFTNGLFTFLDDNLKK